MSFLHHGGRFVQVRGKTTFSVQNAGVQILIGKLKLKPLGESETYIFVLYGVLEDCGSVDGVLHEVVD